tara:strand:+ start:535 stop:1188 length:654 start_codon:yes stop_codon:yes gene_type:complete
LIKAVIKNKNMSTETNTEIKPKTYVWIKTERAGDTVTTTGTEGDFTLFTDGSKIFTNVMNEMLMEARDEKHALMLAEPFLVPGALEVRKTPEGTSPVKSTKTVVDDTPKEINVMLEMLKKMSAKNTISMPLKLNVPSQDVYDLFKDQMDITKADLNEQILALVLSQIDNLQEQLKPQAEDFIKSYYNGKDTRRTSKANSRTNTTNSRSNPTAPDISY